jgi:hypothetical protein
MVVALEQYSTIISSLQKEVETLFMKGRREKWMYMINMISTR